jgi:hypothetical protein
MNPLDGIEKKEIRDLLGKGWLTHDGMWFYHTFRAFGIEKANALNKAAIHSHAPIEIARAKKVLGVDKEGFDTFDSFMNFMPSALELTLPGSVFTKIHFISPSRNRIHWSWENGQCFAYKGMKQIGTIDQYSCGVMYRIECWLDVLGIEYAMVPGIDGCLMHEKGGCEGEIRINPHN